MQTRLTIFIALILANGVLSAQSSWRIDKLTVTEGLSQGYIYALHQDKKGFIWVGTHGGLNRYDGYGFKVFQYHPFDSASLGDNSIFFIKEDPTSQKLWIGGSSCLNLFDPKTFTNKRYWYTKRQIEFDDAVFMNEKEMLLACQDDVLTFNTSTGEFTKVPVIDEYGKEISISRVENAAVDRKGNYMILSKSGIFFYDPSTKTCRRKTNTSPDFSPFYGYQVFNVHHDKYGNYWIATNNRGLIRYESASNKIDLLPLPFHLNSGNIRFDVVVEDSSGQVWAGSTNGLFRIDPLTLRSEYFSTNSSGASLGHDEINVIMEDKSHFMWVGTVGGGINKMIPQNAGFRKMRISGNNEQGATGTYIMGLEQHGNNMWFINIWDQVGKVDLENGKVTTVKNMPSGYSWYSEGSILKDDKNQLVLLNGENIFEIRDSKNISVDFRKAPGLMHIHHSKDGKSYYLVKKDISNAFSRNDTIYGNLFFFDATEDDAGNLWIGTSKGLMKFSKGDKRIEQFAHSDSDSGSISSNFIYSLEIDNKNEKIWMAAYDGGLCAYDIKAKKFSHYTKEHGLPDNIVYAIEKDHHGNMWFTTNAGISKFDLQKNVFRNYGKADGLLNDEFNRRSSYKNAEGWIFFGGILGIDYFHPDSIMEKNSTPILAFTNFRVLNKDAIPGINEESPVIELSHKNRYLSIEFAALDFKDQQKIMYEYRIGNSNEWIRLGNQHVITFTDLAPGTHHLTVRSTNVEGAWLPNEISCTIIIHPPWWQTWWFRGLVFLAVMGIIALFIRSYYKRKLERQRMVFERQKAVEQERTRIAMEMHDDLGSGLTTIRYLAGGLSADSPQTSKTAAKIVSSAKILVDNMNDIIWTMKSDNNRLEDVLGYIRKQAADQLENAGIDYKFDFPMDADNIMVKSDQKRNLLLISKEAVHNIVKHSSATLVNISASIKNNTLHLVINDNGKGFSPPSNSIYGNGLKNMKRRATEMDAFLDITNGNGTSISVKLAL